MPTYGMRIYNTDNSIAYDSTSPGGVFVQYIVMPPGNGSITQLNPTKVFFPLDWASGYQPGGTGVYHPGREIVVIPLIIGTHGWLQGAGSYEGQQQPELWWWDDNYVAPGIARSQTVLMVFVK